MYSEMPTALRLVYSEDILHKPTLLVAVTMACVTGIRSLASSKKSSVLKCFKEAHNSFRTGF